MSGTFSLYGPGGRQYDFEPRHDEVLVTFYGPDTPVVRYGVPVQEARWLYKQLLRKEYRRAS